MYVHEFPFIATLQDPRLIRREYLRDCATHSHALPSFPSFGNAGTRVARRSCPLGKGLRVKYRVLISFLSFLLCDSEALTKERPSIV